MSIEVSENYRVFAFLKVIANKIAFFILLMILIVYVGSLVGCATEKSLGYGTVLEQCKIENKNCKPQKRTLVGAGVGMGAGAGVGAAGGATLGVAAGAGAGVILAVSTCGLALPMFPILVAGGLVSGAVHGALIGGAAGGLTGASVGYAADMHHQGIGLYRFTVKPDQTQDPPIVIIQYADKLILPHTRVQLINRQGQVQIQSLENCQRGIEYRKNSGI